MVRSQAANSLGHLSPRGLEPGAFGPNWFNDPRQFKNKDWPEVLDELREKGYPPYLNQFVRLPAVVADVGLGKTQINAKVATGEFPPPASLSDNGRAKAWQLLALLAYKLARLAKLEADRDAA